MPRRTPEPLQQYRGTTAQHAAYTGPAGEITVDTTKKTVVVQDGVTAGGHPLAKESTTITASNGVEISAGGTLGQNTTVSGVSASTSAPGVVQLNNATDSTAQNQAATPKAVSDALQAAKDYADTAAGAAYTGTAPISVDANTREISVATASTTAKGVMQVGDNMTVNGGVVSVKPWTDYAADHTTVDPTTLQEDAIVVTDESIGYPTAVLAEIEQTVSNDPSKVPSSAAVAAYSGLYNTREELTVSGSWTTSVTGWHKITCMGGGGGGAAGNPYNTSLGYSGGGGGQGGITVAYKYLEQGTTHTCVIGAAGIGGATQNAAGTNGGDTTFDTTVIAGGGEGGGQRALPGEYAKMIAGKGGSSQSGTPGIPGVQGNAVVQTATYGGTGGGFGAGFCFGNNTAVTNDATSYGGGGSGGGVSGTSSSYWARGGNGYQGAIIIEYFDPSKTA